MWSKTWNHSQNHLERHVYPPKKVREKRIKKNQNYFLETLVAKCKLKMASWSSEKAENSSPTFWLKIWRKFWFWRGKTGRVWCPEKWWFSLRLWFGILFCWRDEKFMLLSSQFWMACSTVLHKSTSGHAVIYVGPLRWSFGNFHGCSRGNIIWLGV